MAEVSKINLKTGKASGSVDLADDVFKLPLNKGLLNEYVVMQNRTKRQGTHATKTRSFINGTGKKPFRQKGTGNARQGSLKGPHQEGGAVVFGPQPRDYKMSLNKTTKRKAISTALSQKRYDKALFLVDAFDVASGKTKDAAAIISQMDTKSVLVVGNFSPETWRSMRNLTNSKLIEPQNLNVRDLMKFETCILTQEASEWLSKELKVSKERVAA